MKPTVLNVGQNYFIKGGSDRYLFSLQELLADRGHTVIPFAAQSEKNHDTRWASYFPVAADFDNPGLMDVARYVYSRPARNALRRLLDEHEINIAHLHIYYGKLTGSILSELRKRHIPIVQTLHEYKVGCPVHTMLRNGSLCHACKGGRFWHAATNRCNRKSVLRSALSATESYVTHALGSVDGIDHFIAVSEFLRQNVIALGVPEEKVTTVHSFVDTDSSAPGFEPGRYILYFGRIEEEKGVFVLLEAAAKLANTEFVFAGNGSCARRLEREISGSAHGNVRYLGFKNGPELDELIAGAACTVVPSTCFETFGLTILESFAQGRPVIASRIGGMPEIVSDGDNGYLTEPGDVDELAARLELLSSNPSTAVKLGKNGYDTLKSRFNKHLFYDKIRSIYDRVS